MNENIKDKNHEEVNQNENCISFNSVTGKTFNIDATLIDWDVLIKNKNILIDNKNVLLQDVNVLANHDLDDSQKESIIMETVKDYISDFGIDIDYSEFGDAKTLMLIDAIEINNIIIHHVEMYELINNMNSIFTTDMNDLTNFEDHPVNINEKDLVEIDSMLDGLIHNDRETFESDHCCCGSHESSENECNCSGDESCNCHNDGKSSDDNTDNLRESYINELKHLEELDDAEIRHVEADNILCSLLIRLGYSDVVDAFDSLDKWYA